MTTINKKKCKCCGLEDQEYYTNNKNCKQCCINKTKDSNYKLYGPDAKTICCKKCKLVQEPIVFDISKKTGLHKNVCNLCRGTHQDFVRVDRYKQLSVWVKGLNLESQDLDYLKHIFSIM